MLACFFIFPILIWKKMANYSENKRPLSPLFLDTSDPEEIETYLKMGAISGVTTNPTIMVKEKFAANEKEAEKHSVKLANLINPLPISLEVTVNDFDGMIEQAKKLHELAENVVVKIPIHGPKGELHNLEVMRKLSKMGIRINCTAIQSPIQGLLAAVAGSEFVSLFGGRIANIGHDPRSEFRKLRDLLDQNAPEVRIIAGSTREPYNVTDWLLSGCDIITVQPQWMKLLAVHPSTKEVVQMFLDDGAKLKEGK